MRKHLQMAALIMLIALTLTPVSVFAHPDPGVTYAHASDCSCSDCVAKRESTSSGGSAIWEGVKHFLGKIPLVRDVVAVLTVNFDPDVLRAQGKIMRESGGYMGNTYNGMAAQSQ